MHRSSKHTRASHSKLVAWAADISAITNAIASHFYWPSFTSPLTYNRRFCVTERTWFVEEVCQTHRQNGVTHISREHRHYADVRNGNGPTNVSTIHHTNYKFTIHFDSMEITSTFFMYAIAIHLHQQFVLTQSRSSDSSGIVGGDGQRQTILK